MKEGKMATKQKPHCHAEPKRLLRAAGITRRRKACELQQQLSALLRHLELVGVDAGAAAAARCC